MVLNKRLLLKIDSEITLFFICQSHDWKDMLLPSRQETILSENSACDIITLQIGEGSQKAAANI